mmetsp:Transcript_13224/g.19937  ORF Transcript_13224/g.19937 Transcript_13224/m.19937 type:complete len:265 (-) Transcript_13224:780-1574(-)
MNTNCLIKILLGCSQAHCCCVTLCDFSSMFTQIMKTDYTLFIREIAHQFDETRIFRTMVKLERVPREWLKVGMIHLNIVFTKLIDGLFFSETDCTVLDWCKNSGRHQMIVHSAIRQCKQTLGKQLTGLDGDWGELWAVGNHITNGKNVRHIGSFMVGFDVTTTLKLDTCLVKIHSGSFEVSTNREHHCIVRFLNTFHFSTLTQFILDNNTFSIVMTFKRCWCCRPDKFDTNFLHVISNFLCNFLIITSQQNRTNHHSCIVAKTM